MSQDWLDHESEQRQVCGRQRRMKVYDGRELLLRKFEAQEDRDSAYWPALERDILRWDTELARPGPHVRHALTQKDVADGKWRGRDVGDTGEVNAYSFLQQWASTSQHKTEDLTESDTFLWGAYVLRMIKAVEVVGPGISRFFIGEVPLVSDPDDGTRSLVVFVVRRYDGSLLRIQPKPDAAESPLLLLVDRLGPDYVHCNLARLAEPGPYFEPRGLAPGAPEEACANARGLATLYDTVTNVEARAALASLHLGYYDVKDLSDGMKFPWPLWIRTLPVVMQAIQRSNGVHKFTAISFELTREPPETADLINSSGFAWIKVHAFCVHLLCSPARSLLLFPLRSNLLMAEFDVYYSAASCAIRDHKMKDALFADSRNAREELRWPSFSTVPWNEGRLH